MDPNKQKYLKNKRWKKKYHPRNAASAATNVQKPVRKHDNLSEQSSEDSENECVLKQPIPEAGWFPVYESSSSSDLDDSETFVNFISNNKQKSNYTINHVVKCDKDWFEKELNSIQFNEDAPGIKDVKNVKGTESKLVSPQKNSGKSSSNSDISEIQGISKKKNLGNSNDSDEEELDYLLSLKEPIYRGPVIVKKGIENERKLVTNKVNVEQKPIKSIDLEKWLDSLLDE